MLKHLRLGPVVILLLTILLFSAVIPINSSASNPDWWNSNWSYSQKIDIPIDTSLDLAKYQPVDMRFEFNNKCWAKNEKEHSIRVVCWDGSKWHELESQIYDLDKSDENHIKACSLVFLIPNIEEGNEKYFVYYDESQTNSPNYFDHVQIENSYYKYEPISGYPLESDYYKIIDDGYITYGVSTKGQFMGYNTCQHVTKMKENTTEMLPKNGYLFAAFDFRYSYDEGLFDYSSTSQRLISKEITTDGNLMVEFGIISESKFKDLKTTATYKYYHCPTSNTRMHVHVKHEALKDITAYELRTDDGIFAILQCQELKSSSIKELNFGEMLPYLHFSNELGGITQYSVDLDPDYIPEDLIIRLISVDEDADLGKNYWVSLDKGENNIAHSIIFNSDSVLKEGKNERDGLQINSFELDYPHFPGLENNMGVIEIGRNSCEEGEIHDLSIPKGFKAEFDAEFFTTLTGGYKILNEEGKLFQDLVKIKPDINQDFQGDSEELEKHSLTVTTHLAPSFPIGSGFSTLFGMNFSYINVELYKDNEFIRSGTAVRLPMKTIINFDELNSFEKIVAIFRSFDLKNLTLFKTVNFQNLEPGRYVIKVYKENIPINKEREYIACKIVDIKEDIKTRIICGSEGKIQVDVTDQNDKKVSNAEIFLLKDNEIISDILTDEKGKAVIKAPLDRDGYDLKVLYNGLRIFEKQVKFNQLNRFFTPKESINIERYFLNLELSDTWGLSPHIDLNPVLIIQENDEKIFLRSNKISKNNYVFENMIPNKYLLNLNYKSFALEEDIEIKKDEKLDLIFLAEFKIDLNILDSRGMSHNDLKIILSRGNKKLELKDCKSETTVMVPPGIYNVEIYNDEKLISVRNIEVINDRGFDLITDYEPFFYMVILFVCICLIVATLFLSYIKRIKISALIILIFLILIISFILPWWNIQASSNQIESNSNMFIIPTELVTVTSTSDVVSGEIAFLPDILLDAMSMIPIFTAVGCIILLGSWFLKKYDKRKLYTLSIILVFLAFIGSISVFTYGMSEFSKVGVGSFIGKGNLDINIPGENTAFNVQSNWGPSIGFYLYLGSFIVFLLYIFLNKKRIHYYN